MRSITANRTMQSGNAKIRRVIDIYRQVKAINTQPSQVRGVSTRELQQGQKFYSEAIALNNKRVELLKEKAAAIRERLASEDVEDSREEKSRRSEVKKRYSKKEEADTSSDEEEEFKQQLPRSRSIDAVPKKPKGRPRLTDL